MPDAAIAQLHVKAVFLYLLPTSKEGCNDPKTSAQGVLLSFVRHGRIVHTQWRVSASACLMEIVSE